MKKIAIFAICLWAAVGGVSGQIKVNEPQLVRDGERAAISFTGQIDRRVTGFSLMITPVLYSAEGSVSLAPILVNTRRARIYDARNRLQALPGTVSAEKGGQFAYTAELDYAEWLSGANMRFDITTTRCRTSARDTRQMIVARDLVVADANAAAVVVKAPTIVVMETPAPQPETIDVQISLRENVITPPTGKSWHFGVSFAAGSSTLDLGRAGNRRALDEMVDMIRASRDGTPLHGISILSYGSPEGEVFALANDRALVVRNYLINYVNWLRPSDIEIMSGNADWAGLYALVAMSDMPGRQMVMDIIDSEVTGTSQVDDARVRRRLMALENGRIWRFMRNNFFPQLGGEVMVTIEN